MGRAEYLARAAVFSQRKCHMLFWGGVVVVADDAGYFPGAILVLPEVNEAGLSHAFGVFVAGMVEAVDAHFDRAVSLHVVNLQSSGNKFASHFATDVFFDAVCERYSAERDASLIVVELNVIGEERRKLFEVAVIVGIEESGIERRNRFIQFCLRLDVVERRHGLSASASDANCEQEQRQQSS